MQPHPKPKADALHKISAGADSPWSIMIHGLTMATDIMMKSLLEKRAFMPTQKGSEAAAEDLQ